MQAFFCLLAVVPVNDAIATPKVEIDDCVVESRQSAPILLQVEADHTGSKTGNVQD